MAHCAYRYLSRWLVEPLAHPACCTPETFQIIACSEDAKTAAAAEQKVIEHYPQYAGIPFKTTCIIPAKFQKASS